MCTLTVSLNASGAGNTTKPKKASDTCISIAQKLMAAKCTKIETIFVRFLAAVHTYERKAHESRLEFSPSHDG
jgi:hypothetical protein